MAKEKRINVDVKYSGLKTVVKKNFYALAFDRESKKTVINTFEGLTKLQAKNAAQDWVAANRNLSLEGVYFN